MSQESKTLFSNLDGLWIPKDILLNNELSLQEKILLSSIQHLSKDGECYASNHYFAELLGVSKKRVEGILKRLSDSRYIARRVTYKENSKQVDKRFIRAVTPPPKSEDTPSPQKLGEPTLKSEGDIIKTHNKESNSKEITNNSFTSESDKVFKDSLGKDFSLVKKAMETLEYLKEAYGYENIYTGSQTMEQWSLCEEALEDMIQSDSALFADVEGIEAIQTYLANLYVRRELYKRPKKIGLPFLLGVNSDNSELMNILIDPNYGGMLDD